MGRFLFVIPTLANGGAERVVSVLSSAIFRNGHSVSVIKYYNCPGEYSIDPGVHVVNLSGGDRDEYLKMSYWRKVSLLRCLIKREKPEFVIPFLYPLSLTVTISSIGLRTIVIQSIRNNPAKSPSAFLHRFIRNCLVYNAKCSIVQNESQRSYFKYRRNRIHVLFNPISESLFSITPSFASGQYSICSVGRLESQKNFKLLIDAFCEVFKDGDDVVLNIYGEGSLEEELKRYIFEKGRENSIQLKGRTTHIEDVYKNHDLFVMSSDFEGMPNALMEAMACGLPCISTDCPTGPSELIDDGVNGILVQVGDVTKLSEAIRRMFFNRKSAKQMGENAKKAVKEKCDSNSIAQQMIEICNSIG